MLHEPDVDIKFLGQSFKGCLGLMLVANCAKEIREEMTQLTENSEAMKAEITEVNLGVQRIDERLKKNGGGGNGRNLKRDAAVVGGGGVLMAMIVYAKDLIEMVKALLGG